MSESIGGVGAKCTKKEVQFILVDGKEETATCACKKCEKSK